MREEARDWVARSLEAMNRSKRQALDDYARPGRNVPHWLDGMLSYMQNDPFDPSARYPVVYRLPDPDGRVVCAACFYGHFSRPQNIEVLPPLARRYDTTPEELFRAYCLALGPYAFKVLFGKSLVCNHCERVVTVDDVHVCELEETVRAHVSYVLRDPSGVIPPEVMAAMVEPLIDRAMYEGVFAVCPMAPRAPHRSHP